MHIFLQIIDVEMVSFYVRFEINICLFDGKQNCHKNGKQNCHKKTVL